MYSQKEFQERELFSSSSSFTYNQVSEPRYVPYVPKNNSIAQLNRHTDEPHEHKREIARRLRHQSKK